MLILMANQHLKKKPDPPLANPVREQIWAKE
jgi:hypothetical protein